MHLGQAAYPQRKERRKLVAPGARVSAERGSGGPGVRLGLGLGRRAPHVDAECRGRLFARPARNHDTQRLFCRANALGLRHPTPRCNERPGTVGARPDAHGRVPLKHRTCRFVPISQLIVNHRVPKSQQHRQPARCCTPTRRHLEIRVVIRRQATALRARKVARSSSWSSIFHPRYLCRSSSTDSARHPATRVWTR